MATVPVAAPPNYETALLAGRTFGPYQHPTHGTLTITRRAKTSRTVTFDVDLVQPNGPPLHDTVGLTVNNAETNIPGNPPSVGYGIISLGDLCGKNIIYRVHAAFCATGIELGIGDLDIQDIGNEGLERVCLRTGMVPSLNPQGYYGPTNIVGQHCIVQANQRGWV